MAAIATIEFGLGGVDESARRALQVFAVAVVGWTMTSLEDVYVALVAAAAMALLVVGSPDGLFAALGDNLVWLLVAAFIFAEAFRASGLAELVLHRIAASARTLRRLFHSLTAVMIAMAFVIPSTTGRAAILLPLFSTMAATMKEPRVRVAFALLFPTGVLLGAFGSLVGAGAHIAAVELLTTMTGQTISFAYWAVLGLPLAAASSFLGAEIILRLFLDPADRRMPIAPIEPGDAQTRVLTHPLIWVALLVLVGWMTAPLHGINETLIAVIGALAITSPKFGVVRFRDALKRVDWGLLVFLAATISMAQALMKSNAADQLLSGPFAGLRDVDSPRLLIIAAIAVLGLSLHLVVHSRTARVAVLVPPILLLASEAGLNPVAVTLITVAATGFCQTLMVSAKPVIMFGKFDGVTYSQGDLLRLSAVLAPVHLLLILLFAGFVWPALGVRLNP